MILDILGIMLVVAFGLMAAMLGLCVFAIARAIFRGEM